MADIDRSLVTKPNNFRQFEWARGKRLEQALVRLWIAMQIIFSRVRCFRITRGVFYEISKMLEY